MEKAEEILGAFDLGTPLPVWLRSFYRRNRQMGATDRRVVSGIVYAFYRIGDLWEEKPVRERLLIACLLCEDDEDGKHRELLQAVQPAWNGMRGRSVEDKLLFLREQYGPASLQAVFPQGAGRQQAESSRQQESANDRPASGLSLSPGIDREIFLPAQLIQPMLYIRVRPGKMEVMQQALKEAEIPFEQPEPDQRHCLAFKNTTRVNRILEEKAGKWFEVQDLSSQRVAELFAPLNKGARWWDCCAGSGGKSLLLADCEPATGPGVELFVSDIRPAILKNLQQRFSRAGLQNYHLQQLDLTRKADYWNGQTFDGIILDAPCSGSGTWSRTPEMKAAFWHTAARDTAGPLSGYTALQKKIAAHTLPFLKPGGVFIYITCSVFKAENEDMVSWLLDNFSLELEKNVLLKGYEHKADTLFAARFTKV